AGGSRTTGAGGAARSALASVNRFTGAGGLAGSAVAEASTVEDAAGGFSVFEAADRGEVSPGGVDGVAAISDLGAGVRTFSGRDGSKDRGAGASKTGCGDAARSGRAIARVVTVRPSGCMIVNSAATRSVTGA